MASMSPVLELMIFITSIFPDKAELALEFLSHVREQNPIIPGTFLITFCDMTHRKECSLVYTVKALENKK